MADAKYQFFIAHRGVDTARAEELYRCLAGTHATFLDAVSLPAGARWPVEIPKAQRASRITVVLVADQESHYQTEEVIAGVAMANDTRLDHRLVPVYLTGNGRPPHPPYGLAGFNPIMADDEGGLEGVARALKRLVEVGEDDATAAAIASPEGVCFDCTHGQDGWTPVSPVPDRHYRVVAAAAANRASVHRDAVEVTPPLLARLSAYVLPIGPGQGNHRPLSASEVQALVRFAKNGGGLLLLGTYTGDWHHRWNMNDVARSFGFRFNVDAVTSSQLQTAGYSEVNANYPDDRGAFVAVPAGDNPSTHSALLEGVARVAVTSCCTLAGAREHVTSLLVTDSAAQRWEPEPTGVGVNIRRYTPAAPAQPAVVMAASLDRRVLAVGSWKLFTDAFMEHSGFDNQRLFENALAWLTAR